MTENKNTFQFPAEVIEAFTFGDCWHLARTLTTLTGYPVVAFHHFDFGKDLWAHAANRLPDGRIVDIEGIWSEKDWIEQWSEVVDADFETAYARDWTLPDWDKELASCDFELQYPEISEDVHRHAQEIIARI